MCFTGLCFTRLLQCKKKTSRKQKRDLKQSLFMEMTQNPVQRGKNIGSYQFQTLRIDWVRLWVFFSIKTMGMDFSHVNRFSTRFFPWFHCLCTFLVDLCSSCMHITHQTHDDSFTMRTNIRSPAYLRLLLECTGIGIIFFVTFHKQNVN